MTAYKIDVQCNSCDSQISFVLYGKKRDFECPECGHNEGKANAYDGFIYVMWNPSIPEYVKVGLAQDPERRVKEHSKGSVPGQYQIMALFPSNRLKADEKKALKKLDRVKDSLSKEMFKISPEAAAIKVRNALNHRDPAYIASEIKEAYEAIIAENRRKAAHLSG